MPDAPVQRFQSPDPDGTVRLSVTPHERPGIGVSDDASLRLRTVRVKYLAVEVVPTALGAYLFTRDLPNVSDEARVNLDDRGFVRSGPR